MKALSCRACLVAALAVALLALGGSRSQAQAGVFFVAVDGSDVTGDGSIGRPWAGLAHAAAEIPDSYSTVLVGDGTYSGTIAIRRRFTTQTTLRAKNPYQVQLQATEGPVLDVSNSRNIILMGFDITRSGPARAADPLVVFRGDPSGPSDDVQLRESIVHDSRTGDLVVLTRGLRGAQFSRVVFYNPGPFNSHIVAQGVEKLGIRDSVFFNDLEGEGRRPGGEQGFIVIGRPTGAPNSRSVNRDIGIERNILLGWQGHADGAMISIGSEGGEAETSGVRIESNLFVGNSAYPQRAPIFLLGAHDVAIRANTTVGNMPAGAFAMHLSPGGDGSAGDGVAVYNNLWSDGTGTMSTFARVEEGALGGFDMRNNLYFNGLQPIPGGDWPASPDADPLAIIGDPLLPNTADVIAPVWDAESGEFRGGHAQIGDAFMALAQYAHTSDGSPAIDAALAVEMPLLDLSGRPRGAPDVGALEYRRPSPTPAPTATPPAPRYVPVAYSRDSTDEGD